MTIDETMEEALRAADPIGELRAVVLRLMSEDQDAGSILDMLEDKRRRLREANREREEDLVMDVMDFLTGWCSPHMKVLSDEAKNGKGPTPNVAPSEPLRP
jgi:hypothetical protein